MKIPPLSDKSAICLTLLAVLLSFILAGLNDIDHKQALETYRAESRQQFGRILKEPDKFRSDLLTGDWQGAEILWGKAQMGARSANATDLSAWIDLQVGLVDALASSAPQRHSLRKMAFQEIFFHPERALRHADWARDKLDNRTFADPEMHAQLSDLVKRLDELTQTPLQPASQNQK